MVVVVESSRVGLVQVRGIVGFGSIPSYENSPVSLTMMGWIMLFIWIFVA